MSSLVRGDDHLLVAVGRARLVGGDEGRADVAEVGAHRLRREHAVAGGDRARQRERAVEPLADLLDQRDRVLDARVAAGARGHRDQAVGALLDRLVREGVVDDVVQHDAAPRVHGVVDVGARAQRRDDDGHLVLRAHLHVVLEAVVALVHDLVDRERRGRRFGMRLVVGGERLGDLGQPLVEQFGRTRVERRHRADDAGLALRDHQLRVADDEQRRADDGQAQLAQGGGKADGGSGMFDGQKASRGMARQPSAPSTIESRTPGALLRMWSP